MLTDTKDLILLNYREDLKKRLDLEDILVNFIHYDTELCFNSSIRELLYAIKNCFIEYNENILMKQSTKLNKNSTDFLGINFRQTFFGMALKISNLKKIPIEPPFKNFVKYYNIHFLKKIEIYEEFCIKNSISFDNLLKEKEKIILNTYFDVKTNKKYYVCSKINLPSEIVNYILSYVIFDIKYFLKLKSKYKSLFNKIEH
tara:strand:+ start:293 stop:895 length:603 start_codon:yes stop_codon:yes gene_type:complete